MEARMENLTSEQKWCIYMKYRHVKQARALIDNLCLKEEGIMKAEKSVYKVSRSYKRFARMMSEKIGKIDRDSEILYAKEEGMEMGREEGREEGIGIGEEKERKRILELVKQGLSIEEIEKNLQVKIS
jgi:hypothetical protein